MIIRTCAPTPQITESLSIATWNCRGLSNGLPYIEHLADSHDVIVVSEHWLWPFELHKLNDICPHMTGSATADKRLNPDSDLVRGCGGIGIIWNKQLKAHPIAGIDSDRICANPPTLSLSLEPIFQLPTIQLKTFATVFIPLRT